MPAEFESGVFARGLAAWHGLGTVLPDEVLSTEQALEYSGLANWNLSKEPLFTKVGDTELLVPNHSAIVRGKDNKPLGVVGNRYRIVTNEEAFDWADSLVGGRGFHYDTAGSLRGGQIVWLLIKTPFEIDLPDSPLEQYLLLWNHHDGSGAVKAQIVTTRVVCMNTLRLADSTARASYSIRHTTNAENKLAEAQRVLGLAQGASERAGRLAEELYAKKVDLTVWRNILDEIFPVPDEDGAAKTIALGNRDRVIDAYRFGPGASEVEGTAWGVYNAYAYFNDHLSRGRTTKRQSRDESRMLRILQGDNPATKALELLTKA